MSDVTQPCPPNITRAQLWFMIQTDRVRIKALEDLIGSGNIGGGIIYAVAATYDTPETVSATSLAVGNRPKIIRVTANETLLDEVDEPLSSLHFYEPGRGLTSILLA